MYFIEFAFTIKNNCRFFIPLENFSHLEEKNFSVWLSCFIMLNDELHFHLKKSTVDSTFIQKVSADKS